VPCPAFLIAVPRDSAPEQLGWPSPAKKPRAADFIGKICGYDD